MPFDSNGTASITRQVAVTGQTVLAEQVNVPFADTQAMLSQLLLRSGVAPMTGPLNMNGNRITSVGDATGDDDAINKSTFDTAFAELSGVLYTKTGNYTALDTDYNRTFRFTAPATLSFSETLRSGWKIEIWADGGAVTVDGGSRTINGLASITLTRGQIARLYLTSPTTFIAYVSGGVWGYKGIGEIYMVDTSITGVDTPPMTATDVVYVELTAGLTGVGQFNNGKLTTETVTGTAPLVQASAVISVAGSPMNGQVIRLLNSEGRILRPGVTAGTLQNDAMQNVVSSNSGSTLDSGSTVNPFDDGASQDSWSRGGGSGTATAYIVNFDLSRSARTANETRMKNVAVKAYMRVK